MIQIALSSENNSLVVHDRVTQGPINVEFIVQSLIESSLQNIVSVKSFNRQSLKISEIRKKCNEIEV
jgi:hypothetical protein